MKPLIAFNEKSEVYFLQTFLSNESEAQLLFTIHDQLILTEDFMRRDMAWFTEKEKVTAKLRKMFYF